MKKERMWRLSNGRYVEEELYTLGKKLKFEHAAHSFIVDVDDEAIKQHFSKTGLDEISCTPIPRIPELAEDVIDCFGKFIDKVILYLCITTNICVFQ